MTSRYGLTVDQALARIMELDRMLDQEDRRVQIRAILGQVRSLAYHDGGEDERFSE